MGAWLAAGRQQPIAVITRTDPHKDAAAKLVQTRGSVAGVLKGLPGLLQEESLLGIHGFRLEWRDVEKQRVELVDGPKEARARRPRRKPIVPVVCLLGPTVRRNAGHGIDSPIQVGPELVHVVGPRKAAGHSNDRKVGRPYRRSARHRFRGQRKVGAAALKMGAELAYGAI